MSTIKVRKILSEVTEPHSRPLGNPRVEMLSRAYDAVLIVFICLSIVPLFFKQDPPIVEKLGHLLSIVFIVDYFLGWVTADYQLKKGKWSFLLYPVTFWAIIDMLAIIPFFVDVSDTFVLFRILRLLRIVRVFKGLRYSDNFVVFIKALKKQKDTLLSLLFITLVYVVISGLIVFHTEPDAFANVLEAFLMSASLLTGVSIGEGTLMLTTPGRVIALLSSFWGVALVALPTGVVTGSFITELHNHQTLEKRREEDEKKRNS